MSKYAQHRKNFQVEPLHYFDEEENCWQEIVVENKRATPAEIAACRIDFASWLRRLPRRRRKIALALAGGESTTEAAKTFGVTTARISQLRHWLKESWEAFQGEPRAEEEPGLAVAAALIVRLRCRAFCVSTTYAMLTMNSPVRATQTQSLIAAPNGLVPFINLSSFGTLCFRQSVLLWKSWLLENHHSVGVALANPSSGRWPLGPSFSKLVAAPLATIALYVAWYSATNGTAHASDRASDGEAVESSQNRDVTLPSAVEPSEIIYFAGQPAAPA